MRVYTVQYIDRETGEVFNTISIVHDDVFEGEWQYGDEEEHISNINTFTEAEYYNNYLISKELNDKLNEEVITDLLQQKNMSFSYFIEDLTK